MSLIALTIQNFANDYVKEAARKNYGKDRIASDIIKYLNLKIVALDIVLHVADWQYIDQYKTIFHPKDAATPTMLFQVVFQFAHLANNQDTFVEPSFEDPFSDYDRAMRGI